jgi:methyl-accepting chemotaxis protein
VNRNKKLFKLSLSNVSFSLKLVLLIVPLMVALAILSYMHLTELRNRAAEMNSVDQAALLSVKVNSFVHEAQRERGASGLFLQSKGAHFRAELDTYRRLAHERRLVLRRYTREVILPANPAWARQIDEALAPMDGLDAVRQRIDLQRITPAEAIAYYTTTIEGLLNAVSRFTSDLRQPDILRRMTALQFLTSAKEWAGRERATMSVVFAADKFENHLFERFVSLVSMQETAIEFRKSFATPAQSMFLEGRMKATTAEVQRFRDLALSRNTTRAFGIDPTLWFESSTKRIDQLREVEEQESEELLSDAAAIAVAARRNLTVFAVSTAVIFFGVVLLTIRLSRNMTLPLRASVEVAQRVSRGDLTENVDTQRRDEAGQLFAALGVMADHLSRIIGAVGSSGTAIAAASAQLCTNSQDLSHGTREQATCMEETSAALEQITAAVTKNSESSRLLEKIAADSADSARESSSAVQETVSAMGVIVEKISIVEEIASRTNLLALNAAIEAARVGKEGHGFAVVAAEVRRLAEISSDAARDINDVASSSITVAIRSGRLLEKLAPEIQRTSGLVQQVATASIEQSAALEQINRAITQVDHVTRRNASMTEDLASTAKEMAVQATALQEQLSFFRLQRTEPSRVA